MPENLNRRPGTHAFRLGAGAGVVELAEANIPGHMVLRVKVSGGSVRLFHEEGEDMLASMRALLNRVRR
jgi:hypothetical protein